MRKLHDPNESSLLPVNEPQEEEQSCEGEVQA